MRILYALLLYMFPIIGFAQISLTDFNQNFNSNPKTIIIYFYTDWCGICKIQEKQLYNRPEIMKVLNEQSYFLKINGESKEPIQFLNSQFLVENFSENHSFVRAFFEEKSISYPLWIILDKDLNVLGKYEGLIKIKEFKKLLSQLK